MKRKTNTSKHEVHSAMALFVNGWIWEPVDMQIMQCAMDEVQFPNSSMYRWQAESLQERNFIQIVSVTEKHIMARLTHKGRKTAEKILPST